jgi:hypothetical protein
VALTGGFGALYEQNQALRERLGCAQAAEQGGPETIAEQPFEKGSMYYFQPLDQIYVLIGKDGGTWQRFARSDLNDIPTPTPAATPTCPAPLRSGFDVIWATKPGISEALGCSLEPDSGALEGAYQAFDGGTMLFSQPGLGRGKTIYVLLKDGTFQRFDDPNQ